VGPIYIVFGRRKEKELNLEKGEGAEPGEWRRSWSDPSYYFLSGRNVRIE
jgi:hypothetical protein